MTLHRDQMDDWTQGWSDGYEDGSTGKFFSLPDDADTEYSEGYHAGYDAGLERR